MWLCMFFFHGTWVANMFYLGWGGLGGLFGALTVSTGPWSPPMASIATRTGPVPFSVDFCIVFLPRLTGVLPETTVPFAKGSYLRLFMVKPAVPVINSCPLVAFLTPTE